MNQDKIEGTMKDVAGKVQRKAGEMTGSTEHEVRGAAKQVEGKAQKAVGEARDAVDRERERDRDLVDRAAERDPEAPRTRPDGGV